MFMALGPNSAIATGMLVPLIEQQVMYAVQATAKLQRDRLKSMEVKPEVVRDFDQYIEVSGRTRDAFIVGSTECLVRHTFRRYLCFTQRYVHTK